MKRHPKPVRWFPRHPEKYVGDVHNIIARSSWELKMMNKCDLDPSILKWASEEVAIPYFSQVDQKMHRYFVDFLIMARDRTGEIKRYAIEIKPKSQTVAPVKPKNNGKKAQLRYLNEMATFSVNTSKWEAARAFCEKNNLTFVIFTEDHLGV